LIPRSGRPPRSAAGPTWVTAEAIYTKAYKSKFRSEQREVGCRYGSDIVVCDHAMKVGIALATIDRSPLNALRHPVLCDATGWFIWGGELSTDDNFFQPMHASHLFGVVPRLIPYLALAAGCRVLLAPDQTDVWHDPQLINV
jgi:hypothetical protein